MNMFLRLGLVAGLGLCWGVSRGELPTTILHDFGNNPDFKYPVSEPVMSGTLFYGMTYSPGGCVFRLNTDGTGFTNLHTFSGGETNGLRPNGSLSLSGNQLYGLTTAGGVSNRGVVFRLNISGSGYTNLHNFTGGSSDGAEPEGSLTMLGATLFGVTRRGGTFDKGTIFKINTAGGGFQILHHFMGYTPGLTTDGEYPRYPLTLSGASLYGVTEFGGAGSGGNGGMLFRLNIDGTGYTNLHSFSFETGWQPCGAPVLVGTTLYGASSFGGNTNFSAGIYGSIYRIATNGSGYTSLFTLTNVISGAYPMAALRLVGTNLFGWTGGGGVFSSGVIFRINLDGAGYTNLHSFAGGTSDGDTPNGAPLIVGSKLYGMAQRGGISNNGVVFMLPLVPNLKILLQQGAGGAAGGWGLNQNHQPISWTPVTDRMPANWVLSGMSRQQIILQLGLGGQIGIWGTTTNNVPNSWWPVSDPLAGWVVRDIDGNRVLLQQGDGGMVGLWTLGANKRPATWTALAPATPGLIARSLSGRRVLVQFGTSAPYGFWTLDANNRVTAWTGLNTPLPAGWILRDLTQHYILLQNGDGGATGLWMLDANGIPTTWLPVADAMPGWLMRAIEEQ